MNTDKLFYSLADLNELLANKNAGMTVLPRNAVLKKSYQDYIDNCKYTGNKKVPEAVFEKEQFNTIFACSIQRGSMNTLAVLSDALEMKIKDIRYAKDQRGRCLSETLEITLSA